MPSSRENFSRASNRVKEFLDENTRPVVRPQGTPRTILWTAWKSWADENGYAAGGRNGFMDKVRSCHVDEFKPKGGGWTFAVEVIDPESHDDEDDGSSGGGGDDSSSPSGGETVDQGFPCRRTVLEKRAQRRSTVLETVATFPLPLLRNMYRQKPTDVSPRPGCAETVDHSENCRPDSRQSSTPQS